MNAGRLRVCALWLADAVCISLAWFLSVGVYRALGLGDCDAWACLRRIWPFVFVFTGLNWIARLYQGRGTYPSLPQEPVDEFRRLVLSALATHVFALAFLGFGHRVADVSRVVLVASGLLTAATAQGFRNVVRAGLKRLGLGQIPAFLVGEGAAAERVARIFAADAYYGIRLVRRFRRDELRAIVAAARAADVKHLFCCYKDDRYFRAQLPEFTRQFTFIEYLPTEMAFPVAGARAVSVGTLGGLEMVNRRRMKALDWEKRAVDGALALLIAVCALPLFALVPVLVRLTSRGPAFYRARRLGKNGRPIDVWKFRSMYADADRRLQSMLDADPALKAEFARDFKLKGDPRVTPLGRFLRKTSIDELPQLINVVKGDMALVGPRPIVEPEIAHYGKSYGIFSSVKPGITGLWQVSGRSDTDYAERVALDFHYIFNWSPWLDLWIVFRTAVAVLKMKGSY